MATLGPQQFCVRWNSYHTNLQTIFPKLLTTENFVDVTLACENRQIKCHKVVLSACSTYFERLLIQNPCKHPIIFMKDMRFSEMQSLVDFMYKGEVNVTQDDLPSLLKSAEALQIRGLCGADSGLGNSGEPPAPSQPANNSSDRLQHPGETKDNSGKVTNSTAIQTSLPGKTTSPAPLQAVGGAKRGGGGVSPEATPTEAKRQGASNGETKQETVEEDGLYYGEMENDEMECGDQTEDEMLQGSGGCEQPSTGNIKMPLIRIKTPSELSVRSDQDIQNSALIDQLKHTSKISVQTFGHIQNNDRMTVAQSDKMAKEKLISDKENVVEMDEGLYDDVEFVKMWLLQNQQLEVSLSEPEKIYGTGIVLPKYEKNCIPKVKHESVAIKQTKLDQNKAPPKNQAGKSALLDKKWLEYYNKSDILHGDFFGGKGQCKKKSKLAGNVDVVDFLEPSDLEQFLAGKEVSSSGISRKAIEQAMMGKYNPNRRYSNQAMWSALMDVKQGGSIYRAAQTHKVPRKSLRNWMKRWHIKSSFPMPQQLKQFVENNKKNKLELRRDFANSLLSFGDPSKMASQFSNLESDGIVTDLSIKKELTTMEAENFTSFFDMSQDYFRRIEEKFNTAPMPSSEDENNVSKNELDEKAMIEHDDDENDLEKNDASGNRTELIHYDDTTAKNVFLNNLSLTDSAILAEEKNDKNDNDAVYSQIVDMSGNVLYDDENVASDRDQTIISDRTSVAVANPRKHVLFSNVEQLAGLVSINEEDA